METKLYKNNKTGIRGIYFDKSKNRYRVCLVDTYTGKSVHHGTFKTINEAKNKLDGIQSFSIY